MIEHTMNRHRVIGRFDVRIPPSQDLEQRFATEMEKGHLRDASDDQRGKCHMS